MGLGLAEGAGGMENESGGAEEMVFLKLIIQFKSFKNFFFNRLTIHKSIL